MSEVIFHLTNVEIYLVFNYKKKRNLDILVCIAVRSYIVFFPKLSGNQLYAYVIKINKDKYIAYLCKITICKLS